MTIGGCERSRRRFAVLRLGVGALVLALLVYFGSSIDFAKTAATVRSADWRYLAGAALINLILNNIARVARFLFMLNHGLRVPGKPFWGPAVVTLATRALNVLFPRAGEAYRVLRLHRGYHYPVHTVVAAVFTEPFIEAMSMALPALAIGLFVPFSIAVRRGLWLMIVFAGAGLLGLLAARRLVRRRRADVEPMGKARRRLHDWLGAFSGLGAFRVWSIALTLSWVSDGLDLLMIGLCLHAVGINIGVLQWFLILVSVNVAIAVPLSPGNFGPLEAGAVVILDVLHVDRSAALAFALLYHLCHVVPLLVSGLSCFAADRH